MQFYKTINMITFQKLLGNKEYKLIERTEEFLYVQLGEKKYIFYNSNNELKCFSINKFKDITVVDFFDEHYSMSKIEIIALENSTLTVDLQFKKEELSKIIGYCFKLKNLESIKPTQIINEEAIGFISDFDHVLPVTKWKFSVEAQNFYLIPDTGFCVEFNSNNYTFFGRKSYHLKKGTGEEQDNVFFLNPYTMFDYFKSVLPKNKTNIHIGYSDISEPHSVVIKGTKQELTEALLLSSKKIEAPIIINEENDTFEIHFIKNEYSEFYNKYNNFLLHQLDLDQKYFNSVTQILTVNNEKLKIYPGKLSHKQGEIIRYPKLLFKNNITNIQIVIEYILNDLNKGKLFINNLSYVSNSSIDYEQLDFEENPSNIYADLDLD